MVEVADIFRLHGPQYRAQFATHLSPAQRRAMHDIEQCRTAACGGSVYYCPRCDQERYSYHSCQNRHCPKCQNERANQWLKEQQDLLLPTHHFLVTFTLPAQLRSVARAHPRAIYQLLFRASSQALLQLARDPRFIGGQLGMVGVLHTWTRDLRFHPHVHYLVPGGGLTAAGRWRPTRQHFLLPVKALSRIFRAKFRDALQQTTLYSVIVPAVWRCPWVVHSQPVGNGASAFKYLAPYIFRVAISNRRILSLRDDQVTFSYKDSATDRIRDATLSAPEFIRRFLEHVLPDRFVKVRYYGLLSPTHRSRLPQIRQLLPPNSLPLTPITTPQPQLKDLSHCPNCGHLLQLRQTLKPLRARSP